MAKNRIAAGRKVRFDPFYNVKGDYFTTVRCEVVGTIVKVYPNHKWFLVVYGDAKLRTGFNFCDIGKSVTLIG